MSEDRLDAALRDLLAAERIAPKPAAALLPTIHAVADWLAGRARPLIAGICGAQGSGKSTLALAVALALREGAGLRVATLSLDDFYLTQAERRALAQEVHPLFATRGVPGTHDIGLALATIASLREPRKTCLPRFDKALDERAPVAEWPVFAGPADIILLEGWCVGARPQPAEALATPINALERDEDPDGRWRQGVNAALAGPYQDLFALLDLQLLIAAPSFDCVLGWRREQEAKLAARRLSEGRAADAVMDDAALTRFVSHYERLTRHILADMPMRADGLIALGADRSVIAMKLQ